MAFKFNQSQEGHQPNLALFSPLPVDAGVDMYQYTEYRPVSNQITNGSPIEFNIPGSGMSYIDLKRTRLCVKARILKPDGNPVAPEDKVGFINLALQSLWRQVDVQIQQIPVTPTVSTNYSYKAMLDVLLNYAEDCKETQLQSQLYYKDTAGFMDAVDTQKGGNYGLVERYGWTLNGDSVDLEGPLYVDICQQDRLLINGVQVNIVLYPSSNRFCLMSAGDEYTVDITDIALRVCTAKVNRGVITGHDEALIHSNALYFFNRSDFKVYSVPSGLYDITIEDPFNGQVPDRLVVAMVASEAYNGSYTKNPYNFANMSVSSMNFMVDNESRPGPPLKPNYNKRSFISEYLTLFSGTGKYGKDEGNYIQRSEYSLGYQIIIFDVSSHHSKDYVSLSRRGRGRLAIEFSQPLSEPVSVLLYAFFPATMQITRARNVIVN